MESREVGTHFGMVEKIPVRKIERFGYHRICSSPDKTHFELQTQYIENGLVIEDTKEII